MNLIFLADQGLFFMKHKIFTVISKTEQNIPLLSQVKYMTSELYNRK